MLEVTRAHTRLITGFIATAALLAVLSIAACKSSSVVSESGAQNSQASPTPGSANGSVMAQAGATPAAGTSPAPASTTAPPMDGVDKATAGQAAQGDGKGSNRGTISNFPITTTKARPALTPEPDPFPARPTPTVVMKDGKIVQSWQAPADVANLASPVKSNPDAAKMGREYYMQKCADCHGKNGQGNGYLSGGLKRDGKPLTPTNLTSKVVQANTDGELFWKITNGKSPMPAHRIRFDEEQRWLIVAYLRTLKK